jgi:hypothetical protein
MKPTIKIRFTEPQIALLMRAHPNCNLDHLTELSFEFDQPPAHSSLEQPRKFTVAAK